MLVLTAIAIVRMKDLFAVVMLSGIYGLLSASFFVTMDAVDVAFTEAAVGAGVSTILMLATLTITGRKQSRTQRSPKLALMLVTITGVLLIFGTFDIPGFGEPDAPAHEHVAPRYLKDSYDEIGIPNVVTSVLASYRGYDTMGEVAVIFTAGIAVISMLMLRTGNRRDDQQPRPASMQSHQILRIVSKILIPPIMLFALYVQFHGEYSPGGGFQAGVIFAAAIILYTMLFGLDTAQRVIRPAAVQFLSALGLLIYGSVGVVSLLAGHNYLDYNALASNPVAGQHIGILLIELGVGITVASVMISVYYAFSQQIEAKRGSS